MDADNNKLTVDSWQALKFIKDDVIYMNIKLKQPEVSIVYNTAGQTSGQKVSESTLEDKYTSAVSYALKITLSDE
jgi:hypothetical protein